MATNWNSIVSNANSLTDILMILRKVLAGLDGKADLTIIDEALEDIQKVKTDVAGEIEYFKKVINESVESGLYVPFTTEAELLNYVPEAEPVVAKAFDTFKVWIWETRAPAATPAWYDTGLSELDQAEQNLKEKLEITDSENIIEVKDKNGLFLLLMTKNGGILPVGLDTTIQQAILNLREDVQAQDIKINYDTSSNMLNIKGGNGNLIASITDRSTLHINDVITESGSIENRLSLIEKSTSTDYETKILKNTDRTIAIKDSEPHLAEITIFNNAMAGWGNTFLPPLIIRVSKNRYFSICAAGAGGDFGTTRIIGRFFTIDSNNLVSLEPISVIADYGSDSDGNFSRTNGVPYQVESGPHAGRIYIYYLKRYAEVKDVPCYIYSDDGGVGWSAEVDMTSFFPNYANWRLVVVGPGKVIQLKNGLHKGRIIIPCWHGDPSYPGSQAGLKSFILFSDDGGETYTIGAESANPGSNECQIAEYGEDGEFMLLTRNGTKNKGTEISNDGGATLKDLRFRDDIQTTMVQSGFYQAENKYELTTPKLMITSPKAGVREDLSLWISYDNKKFEYAKQLMTGSASYSDIVGIDESNFCVVYNTNSNAAVNLITFNLKSLFMEG